VQQFADAPVDQRGVVPVGDELQEQRRTRRQCDDSPTAPGPQRLRPHQVGRRSDRPGVAGRGCADRHHLPLQRRRPGAQAGIISDGWGAILRARIAWLPTTATPTDDSRTLAELALRWRPIRDAIAESVRRENGSRT
jgi:hypothetical protein